MTHVEELDLRHGPAVQLLQNLGRVRSLNLEPVAGTHDSLGARVGGGTLVHLGLHVVAAGLGVKLDPVRYGRNADKDKAVLFQVKENAIADDIAVVAARSKLLGAIDGEIGEAVCGQMREQFEGVGTLDIQVGHVMILIEKNGGLAPGALLVAPVGELGGDNGKDTRSDLRIAEHVYRITGCL